MIIFHFLRRWNSVRHKPVTRIFTAVALSVFLCFFFGVAFYIIERPHQENIKLVDSIWWAMVTMTTVGYGDYYPKTFAGRFLVAYPCLVIGIGLVGYSLGVITESMLEALNQKKKGKRRMKLEEHLIICQCPSVARIVKLVEQFRQAHGDPHRGAVVVSARLDEIPVEFQQHGIHFVKGLPTSEDTLLRAGVQHAAGVIVLAHDIKDEGSDAESFTAGTLVKLIEEESHRRISLVIELAERKNMRMMERVGADGIIPVEGITDMLLMQECFNPGLRSLVEELVTYKKGSEFYIVSHKFLGYSLRDVQIAALKHPINFQIIGVMRNQRMIVNHATDITLEATDQIILLAENKNEFFTFQESFLSTHQTSNQI